MMKSLRAKLETLLAHVLGKQLNQIDAIFGSRIHLYYKSVKVMDTGLKKLALNDGSGLNIPAPAI